MLNLPNVFKIFINNIPDIVIESYYFDTDKLKYYFTFSTKYNEFYRRKLSFIVRFSDLDVDTCLLMNLNDGTIKKYNDTQKTLSRNILGKLNISLKSFIAICANDNTVLSKYFTALHIDPSDMNYYVNERGQSIVEISREDIEEFLQTGELKLTSICPVCLSEISILLKLKS